MTWEPELASPQVEEMMERQELPEANRDEVRKFSEFLGRVRDRREGKELPPMPVVMKEFLTGGPNHD